MGTTSSKKKQSKSLTALVNLSPDEVRALAKPREGFTEYAADLIALYAAHVAELSIKGQTPQDIAAELEAYQQLLVMERAAAKQYQLIQETRALRGSNLWTGMLNIYARGRSAGRSDVEILRSIADFSRFMKHKTPRKRASSTGTPPVTTPPTTST